MHIFKEITLESNSYPVKFLRGGVGESLVFFHGAAGAAWLKFHDILSYHYDVIVPEHPGFGSSQALSHLRSVGDLAIHYRHVLDALGIGPAHILGSSFGGWLASEYALVAGSAAKSLTLIGPAGLYERTEAAKSAAKSPADFTRTLYYDQAIVDRILRQKFSDDDLAIQVRNRAALSQYGGKSFYNPDLSADLGRLAIPAHILWGEHDRLVPATQVDGWVASLCAKASWVMPECGHLPHVERPDASAEWIVRNLSNV